MRKQLSVLVLAAFAAACAKKIDGPTPSITKTVNEADPKATGNATICNAQGDKKTGWPMDVIGSDFSPLPKNLLSGTAGVIMPEVSVSGPESYTFDGTRVFFVDKTKLIVNVPTKDSVPGHELKVGAYTLAVKNGNGKTGSLAKALSVVPPPTIDANGVKLVESIGGTATEIDPVLCVDEDSTLDVHGQNFRADGKPAVAFKNAVTGATRTLDPSNVTVTSATQLTLTVPHTTWQAGDAAADGADWNLVVTDPDGCYAPYGSAAAVTIKVGATPTITTVTPAAFCSNAATASLVITGTGFWDISSNSPTVDLLDGSGAVVATATGLVAGGSTSTYSGTEIDVTFTAPAGGWTAGASYGVRVTNVNGCTVSSTASVTIDPPPTIATVCDATNTSCWPPNPVAISSLTDVPVNITGGGFISAASVTISTGGGSPIAMPVTSFSGTALTASVPMNTPSGTYDLTVTNPDGCSVTAAAALEVQAPVPLGTLSIDPHFGYANQNTSVTIYNAAGATGAAFAGDAPQVYINNAVITGGTGAPEQVKLLRVAYVNPNAITAVVPDCSGKDPSGAPTSASPCTAGIVPGTYDILVVDQAANATGTITNGFTVLPNPVPVVTAINPTTITTAGYSGLVVTGDNFDVPDPANPGAFLHGSGYIGINQAGGAGVMYCPLPTHPGSTPSNTSITVDVPAQITSGCYIEDAQGTRTPTANTFTLAIGTFVIRVQQDPAANPNGDPPAGDYSALSVVGTSFNVVCADGPGVGPNSCATYTQKLAEPLMDFNLVTGGDDVGGRFFYTVGGQTQTAPATAPAATSNVEIASISKFGDSGPFAFEDRNAGPTAHQGKVGVGPSSATPLDRSGIATVSRRATEACRTDANGCTTSYLFAIGGSDQGGASIATVERAQVLRAADAPFIEATSTPVEGGGGGLGAGSYYYRVSAIKVSTDPANPSGETLPSDEAAGTLTRNGSITITWHCDPGGSEAQYKIYRTQAANSPSGSELLLDTVNASCTNDKQSYQDNGAKTPSGDAPLAPGSIGVWVPMPSLLSARTNARAAILGDTLYVAAGTCTTGSAGCTLAGDLASVETLALSAGTADPAASAAWTINTPLTKSRTRFDGLLVVDATNAPAAFGTTSGAVLVAAAGISGGTIIDGAGQAIMEVGTVNGTTGLITWSMPSTITPTNGTGNEGGWAEVVADQFLMEGTVPTTTLVNRSSNQGICKGNCGTATPTIGFQINAGFPVYGTNSPRYLVGEHPFGAYIYTAGGADRTGANPTLTDTIERLLF